jgi:hypothetical protein
VFGNTSYDGGTNRNTLGANKAYLLLRTDRINPAIWTPKAPAREFVGIEGISEFSESSESSENSENSESSENSDSSKLSATYNLRGQPVDDAAPLPPGVYIRNGRKIVVK